jgi:transcription elongation factor GreA-like protein/transcription elongation GreA/GreB family factor
MGYLKEFQAQIANHDYPSFSRLWEEYCSGDELDGEELRYILLAVKDSDIAEPFGRLVEKIVPLWNSMESSPAKDEILKLILDIQTSNNESLWQLAYEHLLRLYGKEKNFSEMIRLVGLRSKENFQGAISNFELLKHLVKGHFVFHTGGWGVGEILDVSFLREQISVEFDYVPGKKDISFTNAFKTLIPIPCTHFLAMRFGDPDALEEKARNNPVDVIHTLLTDLGPKTAAEIKDELCDLVIPAKEWSRWWQGARAKLKKSRLIETPEDLKEPFRLHASEISHEERLHKALENKPDANTLIQMVYSFLKDFSDALKNSDFKASLHAKLSEMLSYQEVSDGQELQILFFLEDLFPEKTAAAVTDILKRFKFPEEIIHSIEILAFKKRALVGFRKCRADWKEIFLNALLTLEHAPLRDYVLGELIASGASEELKGVLASLLTHPARNPECFLWYFQKVMAQKDLPYADAEGRARFFESFLVLLSLLEQAGSKELIKKVHAILSGGRYAIVRQVMQEAPSEAVKEFLLLATKCYSLTDHEIKILHSLAEVAHPSLGKMGGKKESGAADAQVIWTTQEGYRKLQQKIQQIATVETVENAKDIEVARGHGDLRENAEFKAALEKRARLQAELKLLTDQLNRARILTKDDISTDEVGVGTVVECVSAQGKRAVYTLLGPWDADADKQILSFQSKLAQTMTGLSKGDTFQFQNETHTITDIKAAI